MATEQFRDIRFRPESVAKIKQMREIVQEYRDQGLRLTARQLYYQFVARDLAPNTPRSYKNLTSLLADARYAGLIAWDAIEDRGRVPTIWRDYESIEEAVEDTCRTFRLPRWQDQDQYAELWVEKQALAGVLEPLAAEYHAPLMVNKGYSSASAMYDAATRFKDSGKPGVVLYLGDHDPSGEDMVRDIRDRLGEFEADVEVRKLALTMDQIRKYNPPPNPAKVTDSRFEQYASEHGRQSWEVDALPPNVLAQIVRRGFASVVDRAKMDAVKAREAKLRAGLRDAAERLAQEDE